MDRIKTIIKQVQSRGWMSGWQLSKISGEETGGIKFTFYDLYSVGLTLSFNDILFDPILGKDFCEKYFECAWNCYCHETCYERRVFMTEKAHKIAMLSMSESERIAFLEKHLEVKEASKCTPECEELPMHYHTEGHIFSLSDGEELFVEVKEEEQKYPSITIERVNKWREEMPSRVSSNAIGWCAVHQREYREDSHTVEDCLKELAMEKTTSKGCTMDDCHCEIGESKKVKEEEECNKNGCPVDHSRAQEPVEEMILTPKQQALEDELRERVQKGIVHTPSVVQDLKNLKFASSQSISWKDAARLAGIERRECAHLVAIKDDGPFECIKCKRVWNELGSSFDSDSRLTVLEKKVRDLRLNQN